MTMNNSPKLSLSLLVVSGISPAAAGLAARREKNTEFGGGGGSARDEGVLELGLYNIYPKTC